MVLNFKKFDPLDNPSSQSTPSSHSSLPQHSTRPPSSTWRFIWTASSSLPSRTPTVHSLLDPLHSAHPLLNLASLSISIYYRNSPLAFESILPNVSWLCFVTFLLDFRYLLHFFALTCFEVGFAGGLATATQDTEKQK